MSLDRDYNRPLERRPDRIPEVIRGEFFALAMQLRDPDCDNDPIDLTGVTEIEFRLWKADNSVLVKKLSAGEVTLVAPGAGRFVVPLQPADTANLLLTPTDDCDTIRANVAQVDYTLNGMLEKVDVPECIIVRASRFPQGA